MDSGLGSDDDHIGKTKEQKQLRNQQILSGCFIDASALSDEADIEERRHEEKRQGALIFKTSITQFSTLQMSTNGSIEEPVFPDNDRMLPKFPETSTPFNSIVNVEQNNPEASGRKTPLGFYVDLSEVLEAPKTPPSTLKKNIFSMVIDFEAPKKQKPSSLSSSIVKNKKLHKHAQEKGSNSYSENLSSLDSFPGPSKETNIDTKLCESKSTNSSSSSEEALNKPNESNLEILECTKISDEDVTIEITQNGKNEETESCKSLTKDKEESIIRLDDILKNHETVSDDKKVANEPDEVKFVKLSDLECQKTPRLDIGSTVLPMRMSRSIPESSWVESPLLMSRSAFVGYRTAPTHPLDPEENEDSSPPSSLIVSPEKKQVSAARRLGTDLLRMFLEEIGPDVTIKVENRKIRAHKCILASRCQYFAALLSGNWLETSGSNIISLQGFSYESVYFALCHVYSGARHVPDSINVVELASLADMLGLEGLKEVVEDALTRRYCHQFHRPCAGCCAGVPEVLSLAAMYAYDELYQTCLEWIARHHVKLWPTRAFASLPKELREKCCQQHIVHMTPDKVLATKAACEKILAALPQHPWAESIQHLTQKLVEACDVYQREHYAAVLISPSFLALDSAPDWCILQIEDQMLQAARELSIDQACRSYSRCSKLLSGSSSEEDQPEWSETFAELLKKIKRLLEQSLVRMGDRLHMSNAWLRLDFVLRSRILELKPGSPSSNSKLPRLKKDRVPQQRWLGGGSSDIIRSLGPSTTDQNQRPNSGDAPSLRRSLLLAAREPQVPPSPTVHRKSTLTQSTQSSAAKSVAANSTKKVNNKVTGKDPLKKKVFQPQNDLIKKDVRPRSPMKSKDVAVRQKVEISSRLSSPIKSAPGSSPTKSISSRASSPRICRDTSKSSVSSISTTSQRPSSEPKSRQTTQTKQIMPRMNAISRERMLKNCASLQKSNSTTLSKQGKVSGFPVSKTRSTTNVIKKQNSLENKKENVQNKSKLVSTKTIQSTKKQSQMQRSDTFLKDEPTVIGKLA